MNNGWNRRRGGSLLRLLGLLLIPMVLAFTSWPTSAFAGATLTLGDILVAEPGTDAISVVDRNTGQKIRLRKAGSWRLRTRPSASRWPWTGPSSLFIG
jgi:hypothetical protein